ncbi:MAG TPA: hypothetical protein VLB44_05390 [Kofleriaceae bacterium]|nr:hypothetical protein [Kofleriaceae bacterium]
MAGLVMAKDDDSVDIEVVPAPEPTPAPAPKKRRPRTPNPAVDDVIHTGEIAPRSMIVKASASTPTLPKVEVHDEQTDQTRPPIEMPRPFPWVWLAAAIVPAIVAGALFLVDRTSSTSAKADDQAEHLAVQSAAQFIGTTLDADAKATLMRAEVIASSSMLRAGILTDAQTLEDQAKDKDVVFSLKPGETVEVFQVRQGARSLMLRLPKTAAALDPPPVGKTMLAMRDGVPMVVANAEIPQQQGTSGEVVLAVRVDVEPMKKRIEPHAAEATLVGLGPPVVLAKHAGAAPGGSKLTALIENEAHAKISLEVVLANHSAAAAPKKNPLRLIRFASLGLAGLLMLGFIANLFRKPKMI